ncbi:hypothetical protein QQZ08_012520 [Neonectria magnoliae]|uniref:Uncharacterized protein n=1 Tax=Neonectria magnoliae TaxID=2732573 RepID=A0ABR1H0N0_9HYPO
MSPRSLKAHIDRAIEQSNNENINKLRAVSASQLKSGDLSIKTATTADMEALRQFATEWEHRVGNHATVRIPTYGILGHGIQTRSMNMEDFEQLREELLQDNKPFIPKAETKYISWLTRSAHTKSESSIVVEFSKGEDANKIIDKGLIWQGEVFQCERCDILVQMRTEKIGFRHFLFKSPRLLSWHCRILQGRGRGRRRSTRARGGSRA